MLLLGFCSNLHQRYMIFLELPKNNATILRSLLKEHLILPLLKSTSSFYIIQLQLIVLFVHSSVFSRTRLFLPCFQSFYCHVIFILNYSQKEAYKGKQAHFYSGHNTWHNAHSVHGEKTLNVVSSSRGQLSSLREQEVFTGFCPSISQNAPGNEKGMYDRQQDTASYERVLVKSCRHLGYTPYIHVQKHKEPYLLFPFKRKGSQLSPRKQCYEIHRRTRRNEVYRKKNGKKERRNSGYIHRTLLNVFFTEKRSHQQVGNTENSQCACTLLSIRKNDKGAKDMDQPMRQSSVKSYNQNYCFFLRDTTWML